MLFEIEGSLPEGSSKKDIVGGSIQYWDSHGSSRTIRLKESTIIRDLQRYAEKRADDNRPSSNGRFHAFREMAAAIWGRSTGKDLSDIEYKSYMERAATAWVVWNGGREIIVSNDDMRSMLKGEEPTPAKVCELYGVDVCTPLFEEVSDE